MKKEKKEKKITWTVISVALFWAVVLIFSITSVLLPDVSLSKSERRKLTELPEFSLTAFWDGSYTEKLEEYLKDQFVGRDTFRMVKAEADLSLFGKEDSGGYYKLGDAIYKRRDELLEKNVRWAGEHFAEIADTYFPEADIYYSVIPDKEELLPAPEEEGYLAESRRAEAWLAECMPEAACISIGEALSLEDYYRTDIHWRQECIGEAAELLLKGMQDKEAASAGTVDTEETVLLAAEEFLGGNACASAFSIAPESMSYVTSSVIEAAEVYDHEKSAQVSMYSVEKLAEGTDPYDFYLWGARALLNITNPNAPEGAGNLIVFRDSFGSSIAPLMIENYAKITLVDLRYVKMDYAAEVLGEMDYEDVLFLYSSTLLNSSGTLRF